MYNSASCVCNVVHVYCITCCRGAKREISREGRGAPILRGLGEFCQKWSLIRAFSELFWGAPGLPGRGARPFWDARGGRPHPRPPPSFCASAFFFTLNPTSSGSDSRGEKIPTRATFFLILNPTSSGSDSGD